ncbi:MAG: hypothetical protein Q8P24_02070 [Desulfobacterales bacterium]|nr:hypothetical protein [Desulfobacterales bacterium]MDZ4341696.1 hypothetical protein [Candidatus Binatia bacterium]
MEKIILNTDSEAARHVWNLSGWMSRDGIFYGKNEEAARWRGCTHVKCKGCASPTPKHRVYCDGCAKIRAIARHNQRERAEWDEKGMIYSESADQFFSSFYEVDDYLEGSGGKGGAKEMEALRLVICEPVFLSEVTEDYWDDDLPENGELPESIKDALEEFNRALREVGPVSWVPGRKAVKL